MRLFVWRTETVLQYPPRSSNNCNTWVLVVYHFVLRLEYPSFDYRIVHSDYKPPACSVDTSKNTTVYYNYNLNSTFESPTTHLLCSNLMRCQIHLPSQNNLTVYERVPLTSSYSTEYKKVLKIWDLSAIDFPLKAKHFFLEHIKVNISRTLPSLI